MALKPDTEEAVTDVALKQDIEEAIEQRQGMSDEQNRSKDMEKEVKERANYNLPTEEENKDKLSNKGERDLHRDLVELKVKEPNSDIFSTKNIEQENVENNIQDKEVELKDIQNVLSDMLEKIISSEGNTETDSCTDMTEPLTCSVTSSDLVCTFDIDPNQLSCSTEESGSVSNSLDLMNSEASEQITCTAEESNVETNSMDDQAVECHQLNNNMELSNWSASKCSTEETYSQKNQDVHKLFSSTVGSSGDANSVDVLPLICPNKESNFGSTVEHDRTVHHRSLIEESDFVSESLDVSQRNNDLHSIGQNILKESISDSKEDSLDAEERDTLINDRDENVCRNPDRGIYDEEKQEEIVNMSLPEKIIEEVSEVGMPVTESKATECEVEKASGDENPVFSTEDAEGYSLSGRKVETTTESVCINSSGETSECSSKTEELAELSKRRKRKTAETEMSSCEDSIPAKKQRLLSKEELKPVKKIISNFFRIRAYWEEKNATDKKVFRCDLVKNLVKHFFLVNSSPDSQVLVEGEVKSESKTVTASTGKMNVLDQDLSDKDSNNNSGQTDQLTRASAEFDEGAMCGIDQESCPDETQEGIREVLSLSQESSSTLTGSQQDNIPIYQASIEPSCGITVEMGRPNSQEKNLIETEESVFTCKVQTQANNMEIDVKITDLESHAISLDDPPKQNQDHDSDQTYVDEESDQQKYPGEGDILVPNLNAIGRTISTESEASQMSELLLENVTFPDVGLDSGETNASLLKKSISGIQTDAEDSIGNESLAQNGEALEAEGSPRSLHSSTSIDYTAEYCAGVVDSSNDVHDNESFEQHSDSDERLINNGDFTEDGSEVDKVLESTADEQNSEESSAISQSTVENNEEPQSMSSEFDSEAIEILSTKSTSESELEKLYGQSSRKPCTFENGSSDSSQDVTATSPSKMDSVILKNAIVQVSKMESSLANREEYTQQCNAKDENDDVEDATREYKSRLPKLESDSDLEIIEEKPALPLKSLDDIHISLSDSSSDELPEVLFLREEKPNTACNKSLTGLTIKEEPSTPVKSPVRSKAFQRLEKTPVTSADESSPRKVLRKRLSLKRTPLKKEKEGKSSPPPRRKSPRKPRKTKDQKPVKSVYIDSDIEIVSGSESDKDFTPSRLKLKQEVVSESDSDSDRDGSKRRPSQGDRKSRQTTLKLGQTEKEKASTSNEQADKEKPKASYDEEDGIERIYPLQDGDGIKRTHPLQKLSSVESQDAGSMSDIFQSEESKDDVIDQADGEKLLVENQKKDKNKGQTTDDDSTEHSFISDTKERASSADKPGEKLQDKEKAYEECKNDTPVVSKENPHLVNDRDDTIERDNEDVIRDPHKSRGQAGIDIPNMDHCGEDYVEDTCPEESAEEWGAPPPLSPYCSQALSPLIPEAGSGNAGLETSTDLGESTSKTISPEKTPQKAPITMEFDSDSEFSGPEVNFDALNSPDMNTRIGMDEENNDSDGDTNSIGGSESNRLMEIENDDELPSIGRKRKAQDDSDDFISTPKRLKTNKNRDKTKEKGKDPVTHPDFNFSNDQKELGDVKEKTSSQMSKVRQLMQKLKAKKSGGQVEESPDPERSAVPSSSNQEPPGDIPSSSGAQRRLVMDTGNSYQTAQNQVQRCREFLQTLKREFQQSPRLTENPRVIQWMKNLRELESRLELSRTVIAVVGDTGSGKSSLMNALLDQLDILPTSGMRACTAVVVEVINNPNSTKYEADITFLSKQEWHTELRLLLRDLTDVNGKIKKGIPDPKSEAGVAFLKIKAVYGRIDTYDVLVRQSLVTRWLDRVRTISHSDPKTFRNSIDKYIETADPGAGGQFWPIVKKVTVRLPNCDACSSGAVLVDLPGVRDSNAARDKIARDHLKNCTAVWVISSIHRAIDDKTAKDLLGENFRRQLLMDGQYGNIAFICTKTDIIKNSEIIRGLNLREEVEPLEAEINRLEMEKNDLEDSKTTNRQCMEQLKRENRELRQNIEEIEECLRTEDIEGKEDSQEVKEIKDMLIEKQEAIRKNKELIQSYRKSITEADNTCLQHEMTISQKRKELSSLCAKARNNYSKKEIKRDFKAGLREMKRKAGMSNVEEMDDDDLYNSEDDDEDIGSSAENLKVFCVSANEYQKMRNIIIDDGPPTVFSTEEDTQIPALRSYIHQMTAVRHRGSIERILQRVAQFVFDIQNYLNEDGTIQTKGERKKSQSAIEQRTQLLSQKFDSLIRDLQLEIEKAFSNQIRPKLGEGITVASMKANEQAAKWGSPMNKENKQAGGLHWCVYRATVQRHGVFQSPSYGPVNFNEDLTAPMYTKISIVWDKVFSGILWGYFEKFKTTVLTSLKEFIQILSQELNRHGVQPSSTQRVQAYILDNAKHQLTEMVAALKEFVTERQRDANRVLTPVIQENMAPTYDACAAESGPGTYQRMKDSMAAGIDRGRFYMFDDASRNLLQELEQIKVQVIEIVQGVCRGLCSTLQVAFEPLWEAPGTCVELRDVLIPCVKEISLQVRTIMEEAGVRIPVTNTGPPPVTTTNGTPVQSEVTNAQGNQSVQRADGNSSALPMSFVLEELQAGSSDSELLTSIKVEPSLCVPKIKKEMTVSTQNATPVRFSSIKSEPSSGIQVCCFCGHPGTNPGECDKCHVPRRTPQGVLFRCCQFCHRMGENVHICEFCKRCRQCLNVVTSLKQQCEICRAPRSRNPGSTSRVSTNHQNVVSQTITSASVQMNQPSCQPVLTNQLSTCSASKDCHSARIGEGSSIKVTSSTLPPNAVHPPNVVQHNSFPASSSYVVMSSILPPNVSQTSSSVCHPSTQTNSGRGQGDHAVLYTLKRLADKVGSPKHQLSASQPVQQGRNMTSHSQGPVVSQTGSPMPRSSKQTGNDGRGSTPYSRLSSSQPAHHKDQKHALKTPSRVPKNLGFKDMRKNFP